MKSWEMAAVLALVASAVAGTSWGDTVTLTSNGPYPAIGLNDGSELTVKNTVPNVGGSETYVGAYSWNVTATSGAVPANYSTGSTIYTYCIQLGQYFYMNSTDDVYTLNYSISPSPMGGEDQGYIDPLAAAQLQQLVSNDWALSMQSNVNAAAFQLAVWEIEYDGGAPGLGTAESFSPTGTATTYFGPNAGLLTASWDTTQGSAGLLTVNQAAAWLDALSSVSVNNPGITSAVALNSPSGPNGTDGTMQDQLGYAVPIPAALPLGLTMLGSMVLVRKLRRTS